MKSLREFIAKQLYKFADVYRRPTMTEQAFEALHTLRNMRAYLHEQEPSQCWPTVSDELQRRYHINSYPDLWSLLERAKQNKLI